LDATVRVAPDGKRLLSKNGVLDHPLLHGVFIAKLKERREDDWSTFCHDDLSERLCTDTVQQPGQRRQLRSHEKGKVWEQHLIASRPLLVSPPGIDLRHQDRASENSPASASSARADNRRRK
jgi:hypothetical protein